MVSFWLNERKATRLEHNEDEKEKRDEKNDYDMDIPETGKKQHKIEEEKGG